MIVRINSRLLSFLTSCLQRKGLLAKGFVIGSNHRSLGRILRNLRKLEGLVHALGCSLNQPTLHGKLRCGQQSQDLANIGKLNLVNLFCGLKVGHSPFEVIAMTDPSTNRASWLWKDNTIHIHNRGLCSIVSTNPAVNKCQPRKRGGLFLLQRSNTREAKLLQCSSSSNNPDC